MGIPPMRSAIVQEETKNNQINVSEISNIAPLKNNFDNEDLTNKILLQTSDISYKDVFKSMMELEVQKPVIIQSKNEILGKYNELEEKGDTTAIQSFRNITSEESKKIQQYEKDYDNTKNKLGNYTKTFVTKLQNTPTFKGQSEGEIAESILLYSLKNQEDKLEYDKSKEINQTFFSGDYANERLKKYGYTKDRIIDNLNPDLSEYYKNDFKDVSNTMTDVIKQIPGLVKYSNEHWGTNYSNLESISQHVNEDGEVIFTPANISIYKKIVDKFKKNMGSDLSANDYLKKTTKNENINLWKNMEGNLSVDDYLKKTTKNENINLWKISKYLDNVEGLINKQLEKEFSSITKVIEEQDKEQKERTKSIYAININNGEPYNYSVTTSDNLKTIETNLKINTPESRNFSVNSFFNNPSYFTIQKEGEDEETPVDKFGSGSLGFGKLKEIFKTEEDFKKNMNIESVFNDDKGLGYVVSFNLPNDYNPEESNPGKKYTLPEERYIIRPTDNNFSEKFSETLSNELFVSLSLDKNIEDVIKSYGKEIGRKISSEDIAKLKYSDDKGKETYKSFLSGLTETLIGSLDKNQKDVYESYLKIKNYNKITGFNRAAEEINDLTFIKERLKNNADISSSIISCNGGEYKITPFIVNNNEINYNCLKFDNGQWKYLTASDFGISGQRNELEDALPFATSTDVALQILKSDNTKELMLKIDNYLKSKVE